MEKFVTRPSDSSKSSKGARSMAELMTKMGQAVRPLQKGDVVEGTIKKLSAGEILLDIHGKGDALVIEYDKKNLENLLAHLHVGDRVTATIISPESEEGFPVVSLRRMLEDVVFGKLEELYKKGETLAVTLQEATRGGYFIETREGIRGFLPNSQLLSENVTSGQTIMVKIIELDRAKKRVIFSQKAVSYTTDLSEISKYLRTGDTVTAIVASVTPYGLYVLITPHEGILIEGFVHISQISYERVEDIESRYKKGDTISAQVAEIDQENRRINLSIKNLEKDNFAEIGLKYKKEQKVSGVVTDVKGRGVTFEIEKGVAGFIPSVKIPAGASYKKGETVEGEITDFDAKRRVIVVSPILKKVFVGYR